MKINIFYSWQSDLPSNTNRSFILDSLETAAKKIRNDGTINIEPRIDRDTTGVPGSPRIPEAILAKIDDCSIFVADVSIINKGSKFKLTSNPNVLFELGYALKTLGGWERIIMICNQAYGKIEQLPFDLPARRVIPYYISSDNPNKAVERGTLTSKIKAQVELIVSQFFAPHFLNVVEASTTDIVLQNAARIAAEKRYETDRQKWFGTDQAVTDVLGSVKHIFELIERKLKDNDTYFSELGISLYKEDLAIVLRTNQHGSQIAIEGLQGTGSQLTSISDIWLTQVLFNKQSLTQTIEAVKEVRLTADLGRDGNVVWKEKEGKPFSALEIADRCFSWLLNQIENPQISKMEQTRIMSRTFRVGSRTTR